MIWYLVSIPTITAVHKTRISYLSSLKEICIANSDVNKMSVEKDMKVEVAVEPGFIALSDKYLGVGMNNQIWYYSYSIGDENSQVVHRFFSKACIFFRSYSLTETSDFDLCICSSGGCVQNSWKFIQQRDYLGAISSLSLNSEFAAVRFDSKVIVHAICNGNDPTDEITQSFPEDNGSDQIVCTEMNAQFLIYGTSGGMLHHWSLPSFAPEKTSPTKKISHVNEYRHRDGKSIVKITPDSMGARVLFEDAKGDVSARGRIEIISKMASIRLEHVDLFIYRHTCTMR